MWTKMDKIGLYTKVNIKNGGPKSDQNRPKKGLKYRTNFIMVKKWT